VAAASFPTLLVMAFLCGSYAPAVAQNRAPDAAADKGAGQQSPSPGSDASQTLPTVAAGQTGDLIHIVPLGQISHSVRNTFAPGGAHLTYWGGPVISNIHVIAVFWGPNVNTAISGTPGISQFFTDITTSRYFDLLTEYSTVGVQGSGTPAASSNQTIGHGTFDGQFTITPSICPGPAACTVTDAQVQAELASQINAGHLPQPVSDNQGNVNSFYMIYFPPGITITLDPLTQSCVQFCAYHSNTPSTLTPKFVPYGVEPDFAPPSGCSKGCGGNLALFDNVTEVTSHEMSEAITDALVGSATATAPPLAWYDPNPVSNPLAEIGDICIAQGVSVPAGNTTYVVQREFSNLQNDCVSAPPVFNLSAPPSGAGPALPFNATLAIDGSSAPGPLTGYTGTVHFTSSDLQAILPADYTFGVNDAGAHVFSFTLNTLGDQTITVTDTHSSGFIGTTTVNVNTTPDLTIAKSHNGNFTIGQTGAIYTLNVTNAGHGPTTGNVTVTDTLPTVLTATAISGTGWSCTLATLACTRADALAAGSSYPAITLTVNVAANAPSLVTNTAAVSGGGETNTLNNSASDPTTVLAPDMTVTKQHAGVINGSFFQGETGATYSIFVNNSGNLASTGTVTVVDTLPPAGLTATDISGTGWSCTLATLTCTRSDALAAFTTYPTITVTVNVALDAPANVVNTATVSGGGEVITSNDVSQDPTTILPPPTPDLSIALTHPTTFFQGQTGTYLINVSNVGTKVTSGTVTVTDTLPAGLTATAMSGTGWACTLGSPLTCTRPDGLAFNALYPTITLSVNIDPNAPSSVTNVATVSGGGDTNPANNSASDFTSIATPVIDLRVTLFAGPGLSVGDTNRVFRFGVENAGNVPSSGPVTVTAAVTTGLTVVSMSGTGWNCTLSTLSCTRSDSVAPNFNVFPEIDVGVNVAVNAPARATITLTVSGGGDSVPGNNTFPLDQTVNGPVTINITQPTVSVTAGQPTTIPLSVGLATAAGSVTFSCSGLPAAASCSFNPPSATLSSSSLVTLTISTTARSTAAPVFRVPMGGPPTLVLMALSSLVLLALFLKKLQERRVILKPVFLASVAIALVLAALSGCGGGGGSAPPTPPQATGTPAGTYAIAVTGTTPIGSTSSTLSLTVR